MFEFPFNVKHANEVIYLIFNLIIFILIVILLALITTIFTVSCIMIYFYNTLEKTNNLHIELNKDTINKE